jgi:hypothetical protein
MPALWDRFTELPQAARTGRPRYDMAGPVEYYAAHPEESAIFNAAMVSKARTTLRAVAAGGHGRPGANRRSARGAARRGRFPVHTLAVGGVATLDRRSRRRRRWSLIAGG